jgi:hypothetical protein
MSYPDDRQGAFVSSQLPLASNHPPCPTNGKIGTIVDVVTLRAILAIPLTEIKATEYRFCPDPNCPTVYYSADGAQVFDETALRERVYQKHPSDPQVLVCYCFQHTLGGIQNDVALAGNTDVIARIKYGIQAGQCACEIRNPQGNCCLGNVRAIVRKSGNSINS